jgi:uncharacterized membrane protein
MTRIKTPVYLIILALSLSVLSAHATYISMQNSVTVEKIINANQTSVNVSITNGGDEAANGVQISLLLPEGFKSSTIFLGRMEPNQMQTAEFPVEIEPNTAPGVYVIVLLTEYKDANGYQFSAVNSNNLVVKEARSSQIDGVLSEEEIGNTGEIKKITLSLRNTDQKDHEVKIRMFYPKELKINPDEKTLTVKARDNPVIDYEVSSFGALPNSNYVIFASMDYVDAGTHYSSTASAMIKVVQQKDTVSFSGWLPIAVVAVLVIAVIAFQFTGRTGRKDAKDGQDAPAQEGQSTRPKK